MKLQTNKKATLKHNVLRYKFSTHSFGLPRHFVVKPVRAPYTEADVSNGFLLCQHRMAWSKSDNADSVNEQTLASYTSVTKKKTPIFLYIFF